jgi:hypothetical protein
MVVSSYAKCSAENKLSNLRTWWLDDARTSAGHRTGSWCGRSGTLLVCSVTDGTHDLVGAPQSTVAYGCWNLDQGYRRTKDSWRSDEEPEVDAGPSAGRRGAGQLNKGVCAES